MKKKKWKPGFGERYYLADSVGRVGVDKNDNIFIDNLRIKSGNCFKTKKEAEAVAKKIRKILREGA